jgi:hypothetical protein
MYAETSDIAPSPYFNHGDTTNTAKNQKPVFAFASRRVAVVNGFESVYFQSGRLKIKRVSYKAVRSRSEHPLPPLPEAPRDSRA